MIFKVKQPLTLAVILSLPLALSGCGDSGSDSESSDSNIELTESDMSLQTVIDDKNLDRSAIANRDIPSITSPLANLGKKLFFSQSLGGDFDSACASCHHPTLGGADALSLPIGVESINPQVLGQGRENNSGLPVVPRNSPTIFNVALWDSSLFWDSRVESLGKENNQNGAASGISTPDSGFGVADSNAGSNLVTAQARFPVTSNEEMKTADFEDGSSNDVIRDHLAARLGDYDEGIGELTRNQWLAEFQTAFNSTADAEGLVTFENTVEAIGEYERSMVFIDSPWRNYLDGDTNALTEQQKQGALLFFNAPEDGGSGCSACHSGPLLSDERHNIVAFPQIGIGKGDGTNSDDDFGRERVTGDAQDRYNFRTPSLLNIATTAPYGHAGAFNSLERVVRHYNNPNRSINDYANDNEWCQLAQFDHVANCTNLYPNVRTNGQLALDKLDNERQNGTSRLPNINLNNDEIDQLVAFLESLTDPCIEDRDCLAAWIADETTDNPDDQVLIGTDINGNPL
ncbi:cytochrome-c peroxidase [Moritella sp. F3]|uniref:cytochrome-c peroxidase n=1 Tax=Moritella sp. F3 TaxID=2718882 RepID=UPI001F557822|nr:cytochrome c peroxidase [Moritella sp. F3]